MVGQTILYCQPQKVHECCLTFIVYIVFHTNSFLCLINFNQVLPICICAYVFKKLLPVVAPLVPLMQQRVIFLLICHYLKMILLYLPLVLEVLPPFLNELLP